MRFFLLCKRLRALPLPSSISPLELLEICVLRLPTSYRRCIPFNLIHDIYILTAAEGEAKTIERHRDDGSASRDHCGLTPTAMKLPCSDILLAHPTILYYALVDTGAA